MAGLRATAHKRHIGTVGGNDGSSYSPLQEPWQGGSPDNKAEEGLREPKVKPPGKAKGVPRPPLGTTGNDNGAPMPALSGIHVNLEMAKHQIGISITPKPFGNSPLKQK